MMGSVAAYRVFLEVVTLNTCTFQFKSTLFVLLAKNGGKKVRMSTYMYTLQEQETHDTVTRGLWTALCRAQ